MNRAILIVICDFVVSAMLSFYTASGPGVHSSDGVHGSVLDSRTAQIVLTELRNEQAKMLAARQALLDAQFEQGFSETRAKEIKALTERLAEAQAKSELMAKKLALRPESSGALSPEQLQKQLETEIRKRIALNMTHQDAMRELEQLRSRHSSTVRDYTELRENYAARQAELEESRKAALERGQKLETTSADLSKSRAELAVNESNLRQAQDELLKLNRISSEVQTKVRETETALSFTRGRLSATEKELAEIQSRYERTQKTITVRDLELAEASRKLQNMETVLKNAVSDLSQTRTQLVEAQKSAEKLAETEKRAEVAAAELVSLRLQLAAADEKLRSDVLKRYSDSVLKVDFKLRETKMLIPNTLEQQYFLPLVNLNGKTCLIGDFLLLTGNVRERNHFDNVTELTYAIAPPEGNGRPQPLAGPIYAPKKEARVGLIEAADASRKPLEVLTLSALKQRGLQDLYLFKHSAFGRESSSLEGRCSMNFASGDEYLYIRNSSRGTGSELRAEPGDFVLTKQGDFVAVVVGIETFDLGRRQEARCVVFPDQFNWSDVYTLPLGKTPGSDYLTGFANAAQPVLSAIRSRESSR